MRGSRMLGSEHVHQFRLGRTVALRHEFNCLRLVEEVGDVFAGG